MPAVSAGARDRHARSRSTTAARSSAPASWHAPDRPRDFRILQDRFSDRKAHPSRCRGTHSPGSGRRSGCERAPAHRYRRLEAWWSYWMNTKSRTAAPSMRRQQTFGLDATGRLDLGALEHRRADIHGRGERVGTLAPRWRLRVGPDEWHPHDALISSSRCRCLRSSSCLPGGHRPPEHARARVARARRARAVRRRAHRRRHRRWAGRPGHARASHRARLRSGRAPAASRAGRCCGGSSRPSSPAPSPASPSTTPTAAGPTSSSRSPPSSASASPTPRPRSCWAAARTLRFRGSIDRVDRAGDEQLVVTDYKYSSTRKYDELTQENPTASGTLLQLPIYAVAARDRFDQGRLPLPVRARYTVAQPDRDGKLPPAEGAGSRRRGCSTRGVTRWKSSSPASSRATSRPARVRI